MMYISYLESEKRLVFSRRNGNGEYDYDKHGLYDRFVRRDVWTGVLGHGQYGIWMIHHGGKEGRKGVVLHSLQHGHRGLERTEKGHHGTIYIFIEGSSAAS